MDPKEIGQIIRDAREAKGLSQIQLARSIGIKQSSLHSVETGETRRSKFLPEIVNELGLKPDIVGLPVETEIEPGFLPEQKILEPLRDFPIYAAVEGGPGEIIRSVQAVDWYPRPAPVAHVRDAYGLFVIGESMSPEFEPGDMAMVNPALPPISGKPAIFYAELHGEARATIKRYLRQTSQHWVVYQHNPPRGATHEFMLNKKEWHVCHRVVGKYYP